MQIAHPGHPGRGLFQVVSFISNPRGVHGGVVTARQSLLRPEVTHQQWGFCCADLLGLWADETFWAGLVEHSSSPPSF